MSRILGVGYCTVDHYGVVDRFLDPGHKREMSTFSIQGGGAAATSTVVLARWGREARFCGAVGDDPRGETIESTLADEGIDTSSLVRQPDAVSQFTFTILESTSGNRQTLYTRGSVDAIGPDRLDHIEVANHSMLLMDGLEPDCQIELAERADRHDVPVLLHASEMDAEAERLVDLCDYLVASERFATQFTGRGELEAISRSLLERQTRAVILTLGRDGVVGAWDGDLQVRTEAYPVDVVDNSGAGDVFAGAFAHGLTEHGDLREALEFANVAGALSCRGLGPRSAIPSLEEVERHLEG